ncbi:hypothetical protein NT2_32_00030 [Caenibius tardaugens NBRC 16725]|uniref:DUF1254 domain-containing protein n=2 Tax=Caenibius TaxID=2827482 RepID=U3A0N2_9SPHN|nr:hypothetical protein NT2_32_00030 [Caenibius tardaugens NBRC 16725]
MRQSLGEGQLKKSRLALFSALGATLLLSGVPAVAQSAARPNPSEITAQRDEALAYAAGLQGYIYGYPALDYMRMMREQTTMGLDPKGVYAPFNAFYFEDKLAEPGGMFAGRGPNTSTIYFSGWLDLSNGPVTLDAPDTQGRYYALTFADLYSEVQHTGRRTTGTKAQKILVTGPNWAGDVPSGVRVIRLNTHWGYFLGRVFVDGPKDLPRAKALMRQFRIEGAVTDPTTLDLPLQADLAAISAFKFINAFLRNNPRLPGEEALMAQFNQAGFGPKAVFDPSQLSEGARRGLERAVADGHAILVRAALARPMYKSWSPLLNPQAQGPFGFNYLNRAVVEANGILGNAAAESVYPSTLTDVNGDPLVGTRRYRLVFKAGQLPPNDAFWALNAYDLRTVDLIPNPLRRYMVSDRMSDLKYRADGAMEIRIQREAPAERDVNWLPINDGPVFLTFRIYQPGEDVLNGRYVLPGVEPLP